MKSSRPSRYFRTLQSLVRKNILRRGYGFLLLNTPSKLWGGHNLLINTEAGEMVIPVNDYGCIPNLIYGNIPHEVNEANIIKKIAKNCQIMVDIGAHIGFYSCLMWSSMKRNGNVFAFEPNPLIFPYLKENCVGRKGAHPENLAASDKNGEIIFYCSKVSALSSTIRAVGNPIMINSVTLDTFFGDLDLIGKIDFIKIDAEGGESAVIDGAKEILRNNTPPILMVEFIKEFYLQTVSSANNMIEKIKSRAEYKMYCVTSKNTLKEIHNATDCFKAINVFFIPVRRIHQIMEALEGITT